MAIGHIAIRTHSRRRGHTVAAAIAYRCGLDLRCARTGERFDYSRRAARQEIAAAGFAGPEGFTPCADDIMQRWGQRFADDTENAERHKFATVLRDVQIALPAELNDAQRIELTQTFAHRLAKRYSTSTVFAVHRPDPCGDARNHHAHIALPTRDSHGKKLRVLDDRKTGPAEIKAIRDLWEKLANQALISAEKQPTVNTQRRLDANPAPTLGPERTGVERRSRAKRRGHPVEGTSAAEMCADGKSVTGTGRRLARHTRAKAQQRAVAQIVAEREAELRAIAQRERPARRRRRRPPRAKTHQLAESPRQELILHDPENASIAQIDAELATLQAERTALAAPPPAHTPEPAGTHPEEPCAKDKPEPQPPVTDPPTLAEERESTTATQPTQEPTSAQRFAARAREALMASTHEVRPPAPTPSAPTQTHEPEPAPDANESAPTPAHSTDEPDSIDWRTPEHIAPDAEPAASRANELVGEASAIEGARPEEPPQPPRPTPREPAPTTPTAAAERATTPQAGAHAPTTPSDAEPSAPRAAELTDQVHAIEGAQTQREPAAQTRPERPPQTRETPAPTPPAPEEPPTTPEGPRAAPSEPLTGESMHWKRTQHVPPDTVATRKRRRSTAELDAWTALRGEPPSRLELSMINNHLAGPSGQPSLAAALDFIARTHLEGRAPADRLQHAFETLRGIMQSEQGAMPCAHALLGAIDEHQAASYGRSPSDGTPLAPPPEPQRVAAAIKSWRAKPVLKQIREIALPFEVLALRADTRRETARGKRERRQRFGVITRARHTGNTDDGQDR